MNTKGSVLFGWVAYTAAFGIGGAIGYYNFYYKPGGRKDRERLEDEQIARRAKLEAEEEERIRQERRKKKEQLVQKLAQIEQKGKEQQEV